MVDPSALEHDRSKGLAVLRSFAHYRMELARLISSEDHEVMRVQDLSERGPVIEVTL